MQSKWHPSKIVKGNKCKIVKGTKLLLKKLKVCQIDLGHYKGVSNGVCYRGNTNNTAKGIRMATIMKGRRARRYGRAPQEVRQGHLNRLDACLIEKYALLDNDNDNTTAEEKEWKHFWTGDLSSENSLLGMM